MVIGTKVSERVEIDCENASELKTRIDWIAPCSIPAMKPEGYLFIMIERT